MCDSSYGRSNLNSRHGEATSGPRTTLPAAAFSPTTISGQNLPGSALVPNSPPSDSSPLLMNPTMAEDVDVTERYLTAVSGSEGTRPYIHVSHAGDESIVYHRIPRRRKGLSLAVDAGKTQREILEQVLGPFRTDVIKLCGF